MVKHLFLSMLLTLALSAFSQTNGLTLKPVNKVNSTDAFIKKRILKESTQHEGNFNQVMNQNNMLDSNLVSKESNSNTLINWNLLCGSMNVYGMLSNQTRPLQYNHQLNAVSFIHRKSDTYTPSPAANGNSGTILAEITTNWGQTWDSTCIWADANNGGRYPQGALYSQLGSSNIANAYVVGCGPVVANNAFVGNWYASKALGVPGTSAYNPTPSTVSGAQQFLSFSLPSYPPNQAPHAWSMQGFTATDDGLMRSLALINDDNTDANTMRGAMLVKGSFNAGTFVWTTDSFIPNVVIKSSGNRQFSTKVQMAWNQSGTVGYLVIIGALNSAIGSNRGLQPIIYKTSNSGQNWTLLNGIDFNLPAYQKVLKTLAGVEADPNLKIPSVDDFDMVVDKNNLLHMGIILSSTFSHQDDSLQFVSQFTTSTNPNDEYRWLHVNGSRPYLFDFIGDGTQPWNYLLVDSLSSEGPGSQGGTSGFNDNPWDIDAGDKIPVDSRLQMGRTPSGDYLTFSWAETDTSFIPQAKKWNVQPNIKTRSLAISSASSYSNINMYGTISNNELNITKPLSSQGSLHPKITNRATFHFMSPITSTATNLGLANCIYTVNLKIPFTVTNSQPYSQLTNNSTWFCASDLDFTFNGCITGIEDKEMERSFFTVFPNPATEITHIKFVSKNNSSGQLSLISIMGQTISSKEFDAVVGENNLEIDLKNSPKGIYFVNVKVGEQSLTKKLVIE